MILIKSVRQDTRKVKRKGKIVTRARSRWDVTYNLPQLEGELNAKILASIFTAELIDGIRQRWKAGKDLKGRVLPPPRPYTKQARVIRRALLKRYGNIITADRSPRGRKYGYARWLRKKYTLTERIITEIEGIKTKTRIRKVYYPGSGPKGFNSRVYDSGMMVETLHARWYTRPQRKKVNGQNVPIFARTRISVASNRSAAAVKVGGMQGNIASVFDRYYIPNTKRLLQNAIWWNNMGKVGKGFKEVMRVLAIVTRVVRYA